LGHHAIFPETPGFANDNKLLPATISFFVRPEPPIGINKYEALRQGSRFRIRSR
jgi:hypothetical protein